MFTTVFKLAVQLFVFMFLLIIGGGARVLSNASKRFENIKPELLIKNGNPFYIVGARGPYDSTRKFANQARQFIVLTLAFEDGSLRDLMLSLYKGQRQELLEAFKDSNEAFGPCVLKPMPAKNGKTFHAFEMADADDYFPEPPLNVIELTPGVAPEESIDDDMEFDNIQF